MLQATRRAAGSAVCSGLALGIADVQVRAFRVTDAQREARLANRRFSAFARQTATPGRVNFAARAASADWAAASVGRNDTTGRERVTRDSCSASAAVVDVRGTARFAIHS